MKKLFIRFIASLLVIFVSFVVYMYWDNNRIKVVEQEVMMNHLPSDLENFTIVQITDLHEKKFGKNQKHILQICYDNALHSIHKYLLSLNNRKYVLKFKN